MVAFEALHSGTSTVDASMIAGRKQDGSMLNGVFYSHCSLHLFSAFFPQELGNLEASCRTMKDILNGEIGPMTWAASAYGWARQRRLLLPMQELADWTLPNFKSAMGNLRLARGLLNDEPVCISGINEMRSVFAVCSEAAACRDMGLKAPRVIVGRLNFNPDELLVVLEQPDDGEQSEDTEDLLCFSNDIGFWMPAAAAESKGTTLVASMGCRKGANVLEISSVTKPLRQPVPLCVDLHLSNPRLPQPLIAKGIVVNVDGYGEQFEIAGLDITDETTRQVLSSPGGVLCILTVHNLQPMVPSQEPQKIVKTSEAMLKDTSTSGRLVQPHKNWQPEVL
jgi:hypothetical protein